MNRGTYDNLLVNGEPLKAQAEKGHLGSDTCWVRVPVGAAGTVRVELPH